MPPIVTYICDDAQVVAVPLGRWMLSVANILPLAFDWQMVVPFAAGVAFAAAIALGLRLSRKAPEPQPLPIARVSVKDAPSWAPGSAPRPPVNERRQSPRREGRQVKVELRRGDGDRVGDAVVIDRSNGGVRLLCPICLPLGAQIQLRPVEIGEAMPWIAIEVRNCRHRRLRGWEMGCLFLRPPPWHVGMHLG
ncbi:MAG: PilZ domain-containing protein [Gemmataceae bacterium]